MPKKKTLPMGKIEKRMAKLRYDRIDVDRLAELTMEYAEARKLNENHIMSRELAEMVMVIIDKLLGGGQYRGYTDDWKEEMRGKAYEHIVKYSKGFKIALCKAGKRDAAFSYHAMIASHAFKQSIKQLKAYTEKNSILNDALGYDKESMESDKSLNDSSQIYPDETKLDYDDFI